MIDSTKLYIYARAWEQKQYKADVALKELSELLNPLIDEALAAGDVTRLQLLRDTITDDTLRVTPKHCTDIDCYPTPRSTIQTALDNLKEFQREVPVYVGYELFGFLKAPSRALVPKLVKLPRYFLSIRALENDTRSDYAVVIGDSWYSYREEKLRTKIAQAPWVRVYKKTSK